MFDPLLVYCTAVEKKHLNYVRRDNEGDPATSCCSNARTPPPAHLAFVMIQCVDVCLSLNGWLFRRRCAAVLTEQSPIQKWRHETHVWTFLPRFLRGSPAGAVLCSGSAFG